MKKITRKCLSLLLGLCTLSAPLYADPETYTLDNHHSYVLWGVNHLGFSTQYGKWYVNGQLIFDKNNSSMSKIDVRINVADVITGISELDKHLRSKVFFDTDQYPIATFVSNKVTVAGKNTGTVEGTLTLRGVSKPVVLHVTLNKEGINPITNKLTVGFTATSTIRRSDFGINAFLPAVGDRVDLIIGVEAFQDKK